MKWRGLLVLIFSALAGCEQVLSKSPVQIISSSEQWVAFFSGGVIKPAYMLLSLLMVLWLRRSTDSFLRLLRHGLLWFFIGEAFCALNFYWHPPGVVYPLDLLHGAGMVLMFAFIPWAFYRLIDERVVHVSNIEEPCLVQRFCGSCWKRQPVRCAPHDVVVFFVIALAIISLIPLSSPLHSTQTVIRIFGQAIDYGVPILNHFIELRAYPGLGTICLLVTLVFLAGGPQALRRAEPTFFLGFGFMGYALFRHFLINTYHDALYWSDFWEELTELLLMLGIGLILIVFRRQFSLQTKACRDKPLVSQVGASPNKSPLQLADPGDPQNRD